MADEARITHEYAEVLTTGQDPNLRNSQVYAEAIMTGQNPRLRNSQVYAEVLIKKSDGFAAGIINCHPRIL